ncbi:oxidoreductase [Enterococcus florum]|uniref:Oxidoreductase n=1 Tax=Enterococcus florum TaxID=2480627 RepID=A0A4P5PFR6_9ENTE|nr:FAD-dependent oxidoreductase [Enterococcus florum]GCF95614.1 oxidoreductase [Enterococcus florum]
MQKLAIIGGGIIGMTLANYLNLNKFEVTLYDEGVGQATKASAGIISPWLSKRRNKQWYALAKDGAAFFPKLLLDFSLTPDIYQKSGTLIFRPENQLDELWTLAELHRKEAPEIGEISHLSALEAAEKIPLLRPQPALMISGGGRLDGQAYLTHLSNRAKAQGMLIVEQSVRLIKENQLEVGGELKNYDQIVLTPGPHLKQLLSPLGYQVDIRPQKGQLLVFQTDDPHTGQWPVAMLEGEGDLIPFARGKVLIGATHENEQAWDLAPSKIAYSPLLESLAQYLRDPSDFLTHLTDVRVGTRAYTSDFSPFFGAVTDQLLVASGLGSSGLTTGPYIGYLLADFLNNGNKKWSNYQKTLDHYIR